MLLIITPLDGNRKDLVLKNLNFYVFYYIKYFKIYGHIDVEIMSLL